MNKVKLSLLAFLLPLLCLAQQTIDYTITVDSVQREFILYVPSSYTGNSNAPLVLSYHGLGGNAQAQMDDHNFRPLADAEGFLVEIKIIDIQVCNFGGPGAGIIKQVKQGVISEAFFPFQIHRFKDFQNLILIKESNKPLLLALLGYIENGVCNLLLVRVGKANHFGKGFKGGKPLIACLDCIFTVALKILKERNEKFRLNMFNT